MSVRPCGTSMRSAVSSCQPAKRAGAPCGNCWRLLAETDLSRQVQLHDLRRLQPARRERHALPEFHSPHIVPLSVMHVHLSSQLLPVPPERRLARHAHAMRRAGETGRGRERRHGAHAEQYVALLEYVSTSSSGITGHTQLFCFELHCSSTKLSVK